MQPREAVVELRQRFELLLVNPPRVVSPSEELADVINSLEFAELLDWIDYLIEDATGEPFYTPEDAVLSFVTLGDVLVYVESICGSRLRTG